MGDVVPTLDLLEQFRDQEVTAGRSPATIEKTIFRVRQVALFGGVALSAGRKLPQPRPEPDVPLPETIEALYRSVEAARWPTCLNLAARANWWRAWMVVASWTGWRLSDLERFRWDHWSGQTLRIVAKKTQRLGRSVAIPVPLWLAEAIQAIRGLFGERVFRMTARKQLRRELGRMAAVAGVPYVPPHGFRRFAISIWSAADGLAGQIIHGCRLGVMNHYLDPGRHLAAHAASVAVPRAFLGNFAQARLVSQERALVDWWRQASDTKQQLLYSVAREILT